MTTIGDAVASLGYEETDEEELCIAKVGTYAHRTLAQCGHILASTKIDRYIAAGAFRTGSLAGDTGRTQENCVRVYDLVFDFDLKDFLLLPKAAVLALPDDDLDQALTELAVDAEDALSTERIPWQTCIRTGYGLIYLARLSAQDQANVRLAHQVHAALVKRINAGLETPRVDPQVKDGGTRLFRLPGSFNWKNPERPRSCGIVETNDAPYLQLDTYAVRERGASIRVLMPAHAKPLAAEQEEDIIRAVTEHWEGGRRHYLALGLAGMLGKAGVPEMQAHHLVLACAGDDEEGRDRSLAVSTTYARLRRGLSVEGYFGLRTVIAPSTLTFIDGILQQYRAGFEYGPITVSERSGAQEEPRSARSSLPDAAFYGWFGRYVDVMRPTTEACAAFHLLTALTYAGASVGRRLHTYQVGRIFPNLYTVLVGETGRARKDTAIDQGEYLFELPHGDLYRQAFYTLHGIDSAEGLVDHLIDQPQTLVQIREFSEFLKKSKREATSTLTDAVTRAWDGKPITRRLAGKDQIVRMARNYSLSLIGGIPPSTLADAMTDEHAASGFANRILWVFAGEPGEPIADPPPPDDGACADLQRAFVDTALTYPDGYALTKTPEAQALWREWYAEYYAAQYQTEMEREVANRLPVNLHKVALLCAATDGATFLAPQHLIAARAVVDGCFAGMGSHVSQWGRDQEAKIGLRIRTALLGSPLRPLEVRQAVGDGVSPVLFQRVLDAMRGAEEIVLCHDGGTMFYRLPEG